MNISSENLESFRAAYNKAMDEQQVSFFFEGKPVIVSYAKYVIEYLDNLRVEGINEDMIAMMRQAEDVMGLVINKELKDFGFMIKNIMGKERLVIAVKDGDKTTPLFIYEYE